MNGQSAENIPVTRIIVQLKDAISKNKTVFNNIMLGSVQEGLIEQDLLNDFTTSEVPLSSKAVQFINSIQEVLKHGSFYLDKFLTVLVEYGDTSCKEVAIKIANDYDYSHQLLPNFAQALTVKASYINSSHCERSNEDNDDTHQLLHEAKDVLFRILRRFFIKSLKFAKLKFYTVFFVLLVVLLVLRIDPVSRHRTDILFFSSDFLLLVFLYQWIFQKDIVIYAFIFSFGLNIMDITKQNDIQITEKGLSHTIIGGRPDSINWLEEGFKMDIFPDSFPHDVPVNITISTQKLSHSKFQLATRMYTITSTSPSSGIVVIHLQHNVVFNDTNIIKNFFLNAGKNKLLPMQGLSKYFMTSRIQLKLGGLLNVSGVLDRNYTALANYDNKILHAYQTYTVSFLEKEESGYMIITIIVTFQPIELKDSGYIGGSHMINESTYVTLEPNGCWGKLKSEEYTQLLNKHMTKSEYSFKLQWMCSWWPHDINYTLRKDHTHFGIHAYTSTNARSTSFAFHHLLRPLFQNASFVLFVRIFFTYYTIFLIILFQRYNSKNIMYIFIILTALNLWFFEILWIAEHFTSHFQQFLVLFDALLCIYVLFWHEED